jgi:hypothetical protein
MSLRTTAVDMRAGNRHIRRSASTSRAPTQKLVRHEWSGGKALGHLDSRDSGPFLDHTRFHPFLPDCLWSPSLPEGLHLILC